MTSYILITIWVAEMVFTNLSPKNQWGCPALGSWEMGVAFLVLLLDIIHHFSEGIKWPISYPSGHFWSLLVEYYLLGLSFRCWNWESTAANVWYTCFRSAVYMYVSLWACRSSWTPVTLLCTVYWRSLLYLEKLSLKMILKQKLGSPYLELTVVDILLTAVPSQYKQPVFTEKDGN